MVKVKYISFWLLLTIGLAIIVFITCSEKDNTIAVTGISLDKLTLTIFVGDEQTLTATVMPYNATDKTVTWTSSDESKATVNNGKIIAVSAGTVIITAKSGNQTDTCNVTIEEIQDYDIYKDHDISACGINDPLQNINWLKDYCEKLKEEQDFSRVYIYLYKVSGTDENVFCVQTWYLLGETPFTRTERWRNCTGEIICYLNWGVHPDPDLLEEFLKDKEYISKIFHFINENNE